MCQVVRTKFEGLCFVADVAGVVGGASAVVAVFC